MLGILIVLFLALPLVDVYLLLQLSQTIGFFKMLAIVLFTGIAGAAVFKREGRNLLRKMQTSVTGKEISRNLLEGILLAVGGLMLITPGLITDVIGFSFVLRPTRERIMIRLARKMKESANIQFEVQQF